MRVPEVSEVDTLQKTGRSLRGCMFRAAHSSEKLGAAALDFESVPPFSLDDIVLSMLDPGLSSLSPGYIDNDLPPEQEHRSLRQTLELWTAAASAQAVCRSRVRRSRPVGRKARGGSTGWA